MKTTRCQRYRIVICLAWLFSALFISQGPLPSFVLCMGTDGHIKVEAAAKGQYAFFATWTGQKALPFLSTHGASTLQDHGGSCVDLPIFISSADKQYPAPIQQARPQSRRTVISASSSQALRSTPTIGNSPSHFAPPIKPTLTSLRTIALLI